jgi:rRNA maturation protein Nop10
MAQATVDTNEAICKVVRAVEAGYLPEACEGCGAWTVVPHATFPPDKLMRLVCDSCGRDTTEPPPHILTRFNHTFYSV